MIFFSLKINNSTSDDDINCNIVSKCFEELCTRLKHGIFPDTLKITKRTPVYKYGDSSSLNNYRSISVLPCFSEMLERIMYTQLYNSLQENKILAHLVSRFACNTRVILNASASPPVSRIKIAVTKI